MKEDANNELKEVRKAKRIMWLWFSISGLVLVFTVLVILWSYNIIGQDSSGQGGFINPLKLLSVNLSKQPLAETDKPSDLARRAIDGEYVKIGEENLYPLAVIIENHPDAHPLAGIAGAQLVYEAPVEGAITRFLAFFANSKNLKEIGPVRSARPYFIDWAEEFSACFIHCGGSPAALALLIKEDIIDINEFYYEKLFWRAADRSAPHNVMTATENLRSYLADKNLEEGKYFSWLYKDGPIEKQPDTAGGSIIIPEFSVRWQYNPKENDYGRYFNGLKQKDAAGSEIKAKNIILLYTITEVLDEELRLKIKTIGEDKAIVCLDGSCTEGIWRKKSATSRTRFYNNDNKEFKFNPGSTWIEVVEADYKVSYQGI